MLTIRRTLDRGDVQRRITPNFLRFNQRQVTHKPRELIKRLRLVVWGHVGHLRETFPASDAGLRARAFV